MHKLMLAVVLSLAAFPVARAAERKFDFSTMVVDQPPTNCFSIVAGQGLPGNWRVIMDDFPLILQPLIGEKNATSKKAVVAQLAPEFTDKHYPMLLLGHEVYWDFSFTTKFKIAGGSLDQMAGIAFRIQDEKNFYVFRASATDHNVRFYTVKDGEILKLFGPNVPMTTNTWHELTVECKDTMIHCFLDGKEAIPPLTDTSFSNGKIALWTKTDSISYFTDPKINYTLREPFIQGVLKETLLRYPKLLGLKVFKISGTPPLPRMIASDMENELGTPGEPGVADVISSGHIYYGKESDYVTVVIPLRDRNGENLAAVRVKMKTFKGQTEENAIVRAIPVVKHMQEKIATADDLN